MEVLEVRRSQSQRPSSARRTSLLLVPSLLLAVSCAPYLGRAAVPKKASAVGSLPSDLFAAGETVLLLPIWDRKSGGSTIHDPRNEVQILGPAAIASVEQIDEVLHGLRGPRRAGVVYIDGRGGDIAGRAIWFHALLLVGQEGGVGLLEWSVNEWWDIYHGTLGVTWRNQLEDLLLAQTESHPRLPDDHVLCHLSRPVVLNLAEVDRDRIEAFLRGQQVAEGTGSTWRIFKNKSGYSSLCGGTLND